MRSLLEKALVALLNEDRQQANALFHDFIIQRSKKIHESIGGADVDLEELGDELSIDEMFTVEDLGDIDLDDSDDEALEEASEDDYDDVDSDEDSAEDVDSDVEGEDDVVDADETEDETESLEDRVDDIESELAELSAEFDAIMGDDEAGEEGEGDESVIDDIADFDLDAELDSEDGSDEDEDKFVTESIIDELENISVEKGEGRTTAGRDGKTDTKSRALSKRHADRLAGKPVEVKSEDHAGFDREAAPKVAAPKKARNVKARSTEGQSKVSKEGDKGALLNKSK